MVGVRGRPKGAGRSLALKRSIVAGIAAAGAHRRVVHRIRGKAHRRIDMAMAALNSRHWNMRWRRMSSGRRAIVAIGTIGVAWLVHIGGASKTDISAADGSSVANHTVTAGNCNMARVSIGTKGAAYALACVRPIVAGIAAASVHRWMVHRIGHKAHCRIDMAIAALNTRHRNMRWRRMSRCSRAIVAIGTVRVA